MFTLIAICCFALYSYAETKENRKDNPHEIRIGIGDCHYDMAHMQRSVIVHGSKNHSLLSTGHLFAEYQYRINGWLGVGCMVDYMHNWERYCGCPTITTDEHGNLIEVYHQPLYSSHISILPTVRFTYFHDKYINIYSSVGLGAHLSYNSYDDIKTNFTNNFGIALDVCALGLSVGNNHWFGSLELGNMNTFTFPTSKCGSFTYTSYAINTFMSKILRVSIGYKF